MTPYLSKSLLFLCFLSVSNEHVTIVKWNNKLYLFWSRSMNSDDERIMIFFFSFTIKTQSRNDIQANNDDEEEEKKQKQFY